MKRLITVLLVVVLVFSLMTTALAASTSYYVDNDTSDTNNCYNVRVGYTAYISDSDYYNGDLRRTMSANSSDEYDWMRYYPFGNTVRYNNISMTVGIYLKSSVLSDTAASYWCIQPNGDGSDGNYRMFYLNQSLYADGWTYKSYTVNVNYGTPGYYTINGIAVKPSGTGNGYSAADAVYVYAYTSDS